MPHRAGTGPGGGLPMPEWLGAGVAGAIVAAIAAAP